MHWFRKGRVKMKLAVWSFLLALRSMLPFSNSVGTAFVRIIFFILRFVIKHAGICAQYTHTHTAHVTIRE